MLNILPSDVTLDNWRSAPFSRWGFQNADLLIPVATITEGRGDEIYIGEGGLLAIDIEYPDGERLSMGEHLIRTHGDAIVVMRDGDFLAEWYAQHVIRTRPHTIFSISKSVTGMLAGIAVDDGALDPDAPITNYTPVPVTSAYFGARVRDLLDMTVGIAFEESYLDTTGVFDRYRRAMLWNPQDPTKASETLEDVLVSFEPAPPHGLNFYYASPNTDMLGLVIVRATGVPYQNYLAEKLWKRMCAKGESYVTVDRVGTARAAGGLCVTARDLARFGQLVLDEGRNCKGQHLISARWINDMRVQGDRAAWENGNFADMFKKGRYRSCWYLTGKARNEFCAVGIHGQWLWIDPVKKLVIAKLSSRPEPSDDAASAREIGMLESLARHF